MKLSAQCIYSSLLAFSRCSEPSSSTYSYSYAPDRTALCCALLQEAYPSSVFFNKSPEYINETTTAYWNPMNWMSPGCVFVPDDANAVAKAVKIFRNAQCKFAVRSGGHSPVLGAASTSYGVLVAMTKLNEVNVRKGFVQVGPGNRWNDVYKVTDQHDVVVLGGRLGVVGVGGLVLGGGLSFQGSEHGLACDTVRNYEVVTADGKVRNVNNTSDIDLFWALKGGSNQFGIVTRFDMDSFPLGKIYAGTITYSINSLDDVMKQLSRFTAIYQDRYPKASVILNVIDATAVLGAPAGSIMTLVLYYGEPLTSPPEIFKPFINISGQYANTVKLRHLSDFALENSVGVTNGPFRQHWRTMTYKPSAKLEKYMADMFTGRVAEFRGQHPELKGLYTWAFEPVSTGLMKAGQKHPGNALGLDPSGGPLTWIVMTFSWIGAENDNLVMGFSKSLMSDMVKEAKRQKRFVNKLYLNDAAQDQPVFESYGKWNYLKLKAIKGIYDPQDVFGTLQTGGFHLRAN